jgi:hypothetical protein
MYRDFGANDWLFEVDETSGGQLWGRLESICRDRGRAAAEVRRIMANVERGQKRMIEVTRAACRV